MARSRVKLEPIRDRTARKQTFKKRKRGMMKKLNELVALCDIKACAVITSPYQSNPEVWPSREGVEEVVSRFMALPESERTKHMLDRETYLWERIKKGEAQVKKLRDENRECQLREFMFDCLKGKTVEYNYDARDIRDLGLFIDQYLNRLTHKINTLTENGESSSFLLHPPLSPPLVVDPTFPAVEDVAPVAVPIRFYDQNNYQNMNVYQQDLVQYPSFMDLLTGIPQQMGYVEKHAPISTSNLVTTADFFDLDTTDHMPSITTTNANGFVPYISNGLSTISHIPSITTANSNVLAPYTTIGLATTSHMPSTTTSNSNGFSPYITNGLSSISHMPSTTTSNANGFTAYINSGISTTSHMPSITAANANVFSPYITNGLSTISHMPSTTFANDDVSAPFMSNNLYGQGGYFE